MTHEFVMFFICPTCIVDTYYKVRKAVLFYPHRDIKNGRLYLGAVGAYDWSGTITKYDTVDADTPDIPKYKDVQKVLPNRTKESYLGYSVITGFFESGSNEYVAAGAPRYMLMGAVVVYRPENGNAQFHDHVTLMGHPNTRQLGAYFGGSVLTTDVNNDGKDDLLIGAPLYVGDNYDEGRVFVYVSQPSNTLKTWADDNYKPLELFGQHLIGGRFGTAMASAGDLNMDGYNDVIVGAPLTEGDRGAVFVYHGNANGVDVNAKQKILASELTGVQLKYFGQSLQGGVDLDGNKYPDIAVGAPKSDTVVIFRSRPVVNIEATIKYKSKVIDIFECIDKNYQNCSSIEVCFTASGVTVEDTVGMTFNLTLDVDKVGADKRLEFRSSPNLAVPGQPTWTEPIQLARDNKQCVTKSVHMKSNIKDYDSPIKAEVKFDLLSSHTDKPLSSVRDPNKPNIKQDVLNFAKKCGDEGKCEYDLKIDASLKLPPYSTADGKDLTDGGKVLVVDQKTASVPVTVKVNLTNNGENAFDTRIKVTYTSQISLSTLVNRIANPPSNSCMVEDTDPVDIGNGLKEQILRYNYKTNIMRQNAWCYFEFNLITENLRNNGTLETFTVDVTAYTSDSSSSSIEKNSKDNTWAQSPRIKYKSDVSLKEGEESEISFNYTTAESNITSITEIGGNASDILIAMEIRGSGYSNIPVVDTSLSYPLKTSHGDMLMYLYKVECSPDDPNSKASCYCDDSKINTYNLTLDAPNENNTNGSFVTITPPQRPIDMSTFDCYSENGGKNFTCETLRCVISDLRLSELIRFKAHFRFWSSSIDFNDTDFDELELHSRYSVNTNNSPYIVDENGDNGITETKQVISKAKKYEATAAPEPTSDNLWIYIVAAIGGLLLLILLVLILWKAGFFKSKYADMKKDAQDDLDDETDFQGNGNGNSTADMVD
ncbi:integrin alpha-9-like [Styela clava]